MALICLTMGIGILSGCSGNNHQESHTESNNSAQEELHSNVSAQENQNESSTESKTEETSQNKEMYLPNTSPLTMTFSSGAGAWATSITLNRDGSFEGVIMTLIWDSLVKAILTVPFISVNLAEYSTISTNR